MKKTRAYFRAELNAAKNDYSRNRQLETANAELLEALEYIYDNADREDVVVAATERIIRKHKGEGK